jgi:hypothetical protein
LFSIFICQNLFPAIGSMMGLTTMAMISAHWIGKPIARRPRRRTADRGRDWPRVRGE